MIERIRAFELGYEDWGKIVQVIHGDLPYEGRLGWVETLFSGNIKLKIGLDFIEVEPMHWIEVDLTLTEEN